MIKKIVLVLAGVMLSSCAEQSDDGTLQGYAEGRQLNLAPRSAGILTTLNVKEGDRVEAGAALVSVDSERAQAQLARRWHGVLRFSLGA